MYNHPYKKLITLIFALTASLWSCITQAEGGYHQHQDNVVVHTGGPRPAMEGNMHRREEGFRGDDRRMSHHRMERDHRHDDRYYHGGHRYRYYHHGNYYNYQHNGEYFVYFVNGNYYNYFFNGAYYLYFVNGHYYNYYYNGRYYNDCQPIPGETIHGHPSMICH